MCARLFSTAARPPPQMGQTNPCGQRRPNKNAAQLASSGKLAWNSVSDRALATGCPLAPVPDRRRTAPSYYILTDLGQRDEPRLSYLFLRLDLFMVQLAAMSLSFYGHVYIDKQYHVAGSWLGRFSWFRRRQQLHFLHHRHANYNFAVIDFFWDRLLGTYRTSLPRRFERARIAPPDPGIPAILTPRMT